MWPLQWVMRVTCFASFSNICWIYDHKCRFFLIPFLYFLILWSWRANVLWWIKIQLLLSQAQVFSNSCPNFKHCVEARMQQGATRQGCGMGTWLGATHRRQLVVGYLPSPAPGLPITTGQPTHPRAEHSNPFSSFPLSLWKPSPIKFSASPPSHCSPSAQLAPGSDTVVPPLFRQTQASGRYWVTCGSTSYLSLLPADTDPTQPATGTIVRVLYSTWEYKT